MFLPLVSQIALPTTANQKARLQRIDEEDFSLVMKKVREELALQNIQVTDDYLIRGINALKQYYAIALLDPANAHAIPANLDPFWHMHILCTEQYFKFCNDVIGEYMHHMPLDRDDPAKVKNVSELYAYSLEMAPKLFHDPDRIFWAREFNQDDVICMHKGNQSIYLSIQKDRLFEPTPAGKTWAYAS